MDSVPSESVRTPRFQRVTPPPFVLTARDFAILQAAATFGTIQSHQLERLIEGSSQQLRRRRELLFNAGYLGRPRCQIARMINGEGSHAMAYTPTPKGAALLALGGPRIFRSAAEGEALPTLAPFGRDGRAGGRHRRLPTEPAPGVCAAGDSACGRA